MTGALLALISAISFGLTSAALRRGVLGGTVLQGLSITVPLGVPLFALACLVAGAFGTLADFPALTWAWLAAAGCVHFLLGRYANFRTTRAVGATLSAPVEQVSGLVSLALALVFLDEYLTPLSALGIVVVLAGPALILMRRSRAGHAATRSGVPINYVEGYCWGAVSAVAFGTSPLLIRFGLGEQRGILEGLAGGLVSYMTATAVVALVLLLPGRVRQVRALNPNTAAWFLATGTFVFVSQMFRYMALAVAPVSVVAPVLQTAVVWRLVFGWLINRDDEVFGASVLFGIALSSLGVFALTLSVDTVTATIALPAAVGDALHLRWP